jgi:hypothetical protein
MAALAAAHFNPPITAEEVEADGIARARKTAEWLRLRARNIGDVFAPATAPLLYIPPAAAGAEAAVGAAGQMGGQTTDAQLPPAFDLQGLPLAAQLVAQQAGWPRGSVGPVPSSSTPSSAADGASAVAGGAIPSLAGDVEFWCTPFRVVGSYSSGSGQAFKPRDAKGPKAMMSAWVIASQSLDPAQRAKDLARRRKWVEKNLERKQARRASSGGGGGAGVGAKRGRPAAGEDGSDEEEEDGDGDAGGDEEVGAGAGGLDDDAAAAEPLDGDGDDAGSDAGSDNGGDDGAGGDSDGDSDFGGGGAARGRGRGRKTASGGRGGRKGAGAAARRASSGADGSSSGVGSKRRRPSAASSGRGGRGRGRKAAGRDDSDDDEEAEGGEDEEAEQAAGGASDDEEEGARGTRKPPAAKRARSDRSGAGAGAGAGSAAKAGGRAGSRAASAAASAAAGDEASGAAGAAGTAAVSPRDTLPAPDDAACCICGGEEGFANDPIVLCEGRHCGGIAVHQGCYSIPVVPPGEEPWHCSLCEQREVFGSGGADAGATSSSSSAAAGADADAGTAASLPACMLCPLKGGAYKRAAPPAAALLTPDGASFRDPAAGGAAAPLSGYVHALCALWAPAVRFGDPSRAEPAIGWEKDRASASWRQRCAACGQAGTGFTVRCAARGCSTALHPLCGRRTGYRMEVNPRGPGFRALCPAHTDATEEQLS